MAKLGTKEKPVRFRVNNEDRLAEIALICEKHNWIFIGGIEPEEPEDISEIEYLLNPDSFNGIIPKMNRKDTTVRNTTKQIGRNDLCSCGSGLKYKKCCMI